MYIYIYANPLVNVRFFGPEKYTVLILGLISIGGVLEFKQLMWVCKVICVWVMNMHTVNSNIFTRDV